MGNSYKNARVEKRVAENAITRGRFAFSGGGIYTSMLLNGATIRIKYKSL